MELLFFASLLKILIKVKQKKVLICHKEDAAFSKNYEQKILTQIMIKTFHIKLFTFDILWGSIIFSILPDINTTVRLTYSSRIPSHGIHWIILQFHN